MNASMGSNFDNGNAEQVALNDLLEVEACLREIVQSTSDPAVLQRLINLHHEVQRYVAEINSKK